ncbi:MAG: HlyD family efflux transporter periplasmic adaptor subunit [Hyphomicrobiales bacterium]|nr:HlyD family efflux transporter periplasmic adaptor subunit [Hyphomicrobiales bacterium]
MQQVVARIGDLDDKILAARDILTRTEVRAPQSGLVLDLQFHTAGGVVQPGQKIMDLVPDKDRLVVDLRVAPKDIDAVYKGMPARARLTAFSARTTAPLEGKVTAVSADRVVDPATGTAYFTARMAPRADVPGLDPAKLSPGMQAEVFLVTSQRTVLDFMLEPVTRSFQRAGRES